MAILESRTKTGISWVKEAVALFKTNPARWMLLGLSYVAVFMMIPSIPGLQLFALVVILMWPVFLVFAIALYRNADMQKQQTLQEVFTTIQPKIKSLIGLGAFCLVYGVLIGLLLNSDIQGVLKLSQVKGVMTESQAALVMEKMLPLLLKVLLLSAPLLMATWFSPMLIVFNNYSVIKAIKSSIAGSIQHMVALGAAWLLLTAGIVLVMIPAGMLVAVVSLVQANLGNVMAQLLVFAVLLLATTLMLAFQYVSYRDVFRAAGVDKA